MLSVNCSHVCFIYVEIYEKISSGGLEVSLSIYILMINLVSGLFFSVLEYSMPYRIFDENHKLDNFYE